MSMASTSRSAAALPPRRPAGDAQREHLRAQQGGLRWVTALGSLAIAALFTALAVRHSGDVAAAPVPATAGNGQAAGEVPSQSLFEGQADTGQGGGSFLAPAGGSFGRARVRSSSS